MPVIREPTDYIPNSADTSQNVSREISHATFPKGNTDPDIVPIDADSGNRRPKVVSVFCREHHGQLAPAPYSIRPGQLVDILTISLPEKVLLWTTFIIKILLA